MVKRKLKFRKKVQRPITPAPDIGEYIKIGDRIAIIGDVFVVKRVERTTLVCHKLNPHIMFPGPIQYLRVGVYDGRIREMYHKNEVVVMAREPWRDALKEGYLINYGMYGKCGVIERDGDYMTLQPIGNTMTFRVHIDSYGLSGQLPLSCGFVPEPLYERTEWMYARVIAEAWSGCIVDEVPNADIYLVHRYGSRYDDSVDNEGWVANMRWFSKFYLEKKFSIETYADEMNENIKLGSFEISREFFESLSDAGSFPWVTWMKMCAIGDDDIILRDLLDILQQTTTSDVRQASASMNGYNIHEINALQHGLNLMLNDSVQFYFPSYSKHQLRYFTIDRQHQFIEKLAQKKMEVLCSSIVSDKTVIDVALQRYYFHTKTNIFPHYANGIQLNRKKHRKSQISVKIVSVDEHVLKVDMFFHGTAGRLSRVMQKYTHRMITTSIGHIMHWFCKKFDFSSIDIGTIFDTRSEWYDRRHTVYSHLKLFEYQKIIVKQMYDRELNEPKAISHCLNGVYSGIEHNFIDGMAPYCRMDSTGGILKMDVGLGKTVCMLALCELNPKKTLVVVPLTLIDQWRDEIKRFLPHRTISEYYGPKKSFDGDIVLTTYGTVRKSYSNSTPIVLCDRVIFDESHTVNKPNSMMANACTWIVARYRWCLSATPIENNDITSLNTQLKILHVEPFRRSVDFSYHFFMARGDIYRKIVHSVVTKVFFAQTYKGLDNHSLSRSTTVIHQHQIDVDGLNDDYEYLQERLTARLHENPERMHRYQTVRQFSNLLQMCATQPGIVPLMFYAHSVEHVVATMTVDRLQRTMGSSGYQKSLKDTLNNLEDETCVICLDILNRPTVTPCFHVFCNECIAQHMAHRRNCPMCREEFDARRLTEIAEDKDIETVGDDISITDMVGRKCTIDKDRYAQWNDSQGRLFKSPKLNALDQLISNNCLDSFVIFSQHASVINLLRNKYPDADVITGAHTRKQRKDAVGRFQAKKSKLFILSTKCASIGLTLTSGTRLVFMEPMLDDTVYTQAIGRVARTGQTSDVHVYTMVNTRTIDEDIVGLKQNFSRARDTKRSKSHRRILHNFTLKLFKL